ncbi:MAG TPA: single-stranded DNA-binding protein [Chloroflexota bacterium]|nr:single-stranded DNA-binding protein [Chloroflexota bacterium]
MARGLNKCMIIGNVGRDPEMRYTSNGTAVTSFSVAVSRTWNPREGGDQRDETEWFNIVTWSKLAETCNQYLTKGQRVFVEGRLQTRSWDGNDGQKHYRTELIANDMMMLTPRGETAPAGAGRDEFDPGADSEPDDIPF